MNRKRSGSGTEHANLIAYSLVGAVILFSAAGCEKDTGIAPDYEKTISQENIDAAVYVDASIGNDDYDGLSRTVIGNGVGPKKTIQAGIDITPKRRICSVAAGTYCEQIAMADGVILMGAGADVTVIDVGRNRGNGIRIVDCNTYQTVVCGFTIRNGSCYGDNAGIRIQHSSNVLIYYNVITANLADGIRTYAASARIMNNTIVRNGRNGIMACNGSALEVINNIIADNCPEWPEGSEFGWGLYVTSSSVINSSYNNVWRQNVNYGIGTGGVCSPGTGDVSIDPMFVDPRNNYHLGSGSPCIDVGIDVGLKYNGAAPDMGAFEFKR